MYTCPVYSVYQNIAVFVDCYYYSYNNLLLLVGNSSDIHNFSHMMNNTLVIPMVLDYLLFIIVGVFSRYLGYVDDDDDDLIMVDMGNL